MSLKEIVVYVYKMCAEKSSKKSERFWDEEDSDDERNDMSE